MDCRVIDTFPCYACGMPCSLIEEIKTGMEAVVHEEPSCETFKASGPENFVHECIRKSRNEKPN